MGYKLAGFNVLGGVDIDPQMVKIYRTNHHPKISFQMSVRDLLKADLPPELFNLDVLDGSPPCSSFSTAGSRDKAWGKKKVFREGQAAQRLDDLFFDFIDIAAALRPKVVIAENVKGLVIGKAKGYVKEIFAAFKAAGYDPQLFLLNASRMGVPQRRERTFFVARRSDLGMPKITLDFNDRPIPFDEIKQGITQDGPWSGQYEPIDCVKGLLKFVGRFDTSLAKASTIKNGTGSFHAHLLAWPGTVLATQIANGGSITVMPEERRITDVERLRSQTFPVDYNFCGLSVQYVCGMSVPPFMMQRVASQVRRQLLDALEAP